MNIAISVNQSQLLDVLLNVAVVRPVFIWGAPGIGKSSIVENFAESLGLPCVSLLGSQLAPEDIIGVPQIIDGKSVFCPPRMIAREEPYCLFLDELNACSQEVQKAFSTPRSWHMLSDALYSYGDKITEKELEILANGCLSPQHAVQFRAFIKQIRNRYALSAIIDGEQKWPNAPGDRDALYFLAQSFRAQLIKELPKDKNNMTGNAQALGIRAKALMKDLANISLEIAQMAVAATESESLPDWFMVEIVRDLPRLAEKSK